MIIGTRGSKLALKQTEIFTDKLNEEFEVKVVSTKGDKSGKPLPELGIGAFVKELDQALLDREIDIAIHSLKDIPVEMPEGLNIVAIVERGDERDCLVGSRLEDLPHGATVGASSERRKAELLSLKSDINIKPLRGNVPTRIEKQEKGEYDAIVVAKCALDRLNIAKKASEVFEVEDMVPAAGQGAIAIVCREGEDFDLSLDDGLFSCCMLERNFINGLGGCQNPVGAYCRLDENEFVLIGLIYGGGKRIIKKFRGDKDSVSKQISEWKEEFI